MLSILKQLKYIWLLNNDTTVKPNTLYCLVNYMSNADVQLGILGNKLLFFRRSYKNSSNWRCI